MATTLYPMVQFKRDTWELDEFDCASIFLLVGTERALLIDTGIGVGDLKAAVEKDHRQACDGGHNSWTWRPSWQCLEIS